MKREYRMPHSPIRKHSRESNLIVTRPKTARYDVYTDKNGNDRRGLFPPLPQDCHNCGKKGHIAPACMSKSKAQYKAVTRYSKPKFQGTNLIQQDVQQDDNNTDSEEESFHLFKLTEPSSNTIKITVDIEGQLLRMEVDTGAAVSIISDKTRQDKFPHLKLWKSRLVLKTYTDEPMHIMGQLNVHVTHNMQMVPLVLVVVAGEGPSLFGRNWLKYIQLDWKRIATVHIKSPNLEMLLQKYEDLFKEELPYFLDYSAPLFSSRPRIDRALCPGLRVILRALE